MVELGGWVSYLEVILWGWEWEDRNCICVYRCVGGGGRIGWVVCVEVQLWNDIDIDIDRRDGYQGSDGDYIV